MIYVDSMNAKFGRMIMCHLISDNSIEELQNFADKIGMKREWFQSKSFPHYDISLMKKKEAILLGAKEVDRRELVEAIKRFRGKEAEFNIYVEQAKIIVQTFTNPETAFRGNNNVEEGLIHWLFEQDFFIDEKASETGECLPDELISHYLADAGANNNQIDQVLKIAHMED
jgi:hypothetical protein